MAQACVGLAEQGGVRRLAGLRGLSQVARSAKHLDLLRTAAADEADLDWRTLTRRAALGDFDAEAVESLGERDPDPDAWTRAVAVDAAQPSAEAKERAWQHAFDDHFPIGSLYDLSLAFWQPHQADVLAPYADRFLAELPALNNQGAMGARARSGWMFPYFGVDTGFAEQVEAHAALDTTTPLIRARLLECADQLRRMLRARAM
jgi:aminopeptidase N